MPAHEGVPGNAFCQGCIDSIFNDDIHLLWSKLAGKKAIVMCRTGRQKVVHPTAHNEFADSDLENINDNGAEDEDEDEDEDDDDNVQDDDYEGENKCQFCCFVFDEIQKWQSATLDTSKEKPEQAQSTVTIHDSNSDGAEARAARPDVSSARNRPRT